MPTELKTSSFCHSGGCAGVHVDAETGTVSVSKVADGEPIGSPRVHSETAWKVKSELVGRGLLPTATLLPKDGVTFDKGEKQALRAGLRAGEFKLPKKPATQKIA